MPISRLEKTFHFLLTFSMRTSQEDRELISSGLALVRRFVAAGAKPEAKYTLLMVSRSPAIETDIPLGGWQDVVMSLDAMGETQESLLLLRRLIEKIEKTPGAGENITRARLLWMLGQHEGNQGDYVPSLNMCPSCREGGRWLAERALCYT